MKNLIFNIEKAFNIPKVELNYLSEALEEIHLEKGESFLKLGDVCGKIGFLTKGSMRLFYESPEKETCNEFFFENSLIGSLGSFMSQTPSISHIVAIENCKIFALTREKVMELISTHKTFQFMSQIILQEHFLKTEKRAATLLLDNPEARFKKLTEEHPKIFKRIPLHYVASYLGITPETLSRYRSKFLV